MRESHKRILVMLHANIKFRHNSRPLFSMLFHLITSAAERQAWGFVKLCQNINFDKKQKLDLCNRPKVSKGLGAGIDFLSGDDYYLIVVNSLLTFGQAVPFIPLFLFGNTS